MTAAATPAAPAASSAAASAAIQRAELKKARLRPVIVQTATSLQNLATAAAALRLLPGGGELADTLARVLNTAVNKGGTIKTKNGKLVRSLPPKDATPKVGAAWLVTIAPWAMRAAGAAATAARVGLGRFGGALVGNLRAGAGYVASKAGQLIAAAKNNPTFAKVASIAGKALTAASVLLGIQAAAKVVMPGTAKAVDDAAAAAVRKVRRGGSVAVRKAADAAAAIPEAAANAADRVTSGLKWAAVLAAALAAAKFL
jgi:hypothetical protein